MKIYTVSCLYRAHSSGWGDPYVKSFSSLEKASEYLLQEFRAYMADMNYPEDWDADDMFTDESRKTPAPAPTLEMAKILFSVDSLERFLNDTKRYSNILYGVWSDFECQNPFEIEFYESELD